MTYFGRRGERKGEFFQPWGIACDSDGKVYVADSGNKRIQIFTEEGNHIQSINLNLKYPIAVAVNFDGLVLISTNEWRHHEEMCVHMFDRLDEDDSEYDHVNLLEVVYPCGMVLDQCGVLYVCDSANNEVSIF